MQSRFLIGAALLALAAAATAQIPQVGSRSYFLYGTGIGNGGFRISAVNGVTELLVPCGAEGFGSGSRYWILHRHNGATNQYDQVFASPVYPANDGIVRTAVGDVDPAPGPEIVVVTRNGTVEVWNQAARTRLVSFTANLGEVKGMGLGDADGDGDLDVLLCSTAALQARSSAGAVLWTVNGAGGNDLTIAQMDADPALEVAVTSGRVVDCGTRLVQFHWQNGFGMDVDSADIDGDGRAELVFAEDWNWIWAFDIDTQLPKWSLPTGDTDCIALAQADADPALELIVGEGQWGDVRVYDVATQQIEFSVPNAEHGVTSVAAGDVDGDGQIEIVFGAGWTSTGADFCYVADAATQAIEWTSPGIAGPFVGPVRGDIDGDTTFELVFAAPGQWPSSNARILVFDEATLDLEHVSAALPTGFSQGAPTDIELADVDGDGDAEVFLATGAATCYGWTGTGFQQIWQVGGSSSSGPSFREIAVVDLDGTSPLEVVLGSQQYAHVYAFGATTETWRSFYLGGEVRELAIGSTDTTPEPEIHALSADGNIYVFDGPTRATEAILQDGGVDRRSVHCLEGIPALITGDVAGNMFLYGTAGVGYWSLGPLPIAPGPIHSLGYYPALGLLRVSANERLALQFGLTPAWRTADYGPGFADKVWLDFANVQVVTAGPFGITLFAL